MVNGGSAPFSIVYFNGETEIKVGTVVVDSSLNFKKFLSIISHKIGISPHQFSVYLATLRSDRKIPITGKVNLAAIARDEDDSFFFVKRSRRCKKNQTHKKDMQSNKRKPPENAMLLRRNGEHLSEFKMATLPIMDPVEYERQMRNLQMERERYLMNMGLFGREPSGGGGGGMVCEKCLRAKETGRDGGFHWCVYDAVTVGFRSPAGPVARPIKKSG